MSILLLTLVFHLLFWCIMFMVIIRHNDNITDEKHSVSSITSIKNGKNDIVPFSDIMMEQELDEIIMIDDFSDDDSFLYLKDKKIISLVPDKDIIGKKEAIVKGISHATSDYLLFTDVDCRPRSHWAKAMKERVQDKDILLGYGPMNRLKGWIALFSRYETYHTALQYFTMADLGQAYMGVGRNMMVKKEKAITAVPILLASKMASGDDDIMINHLAKADNVMIALDQETYVYSDPKVTISSFLKQKARHISSSVEYKLSHQGILFLYSFSFISFYIGLILNILFHLISWKQLAILLLIKWGVQLLFNFFLMKKLHETDLLKYFPLLDILMFLYLIILPPYYIILKKTEWN